ncbi:hypothetical protein CsSME_00040453 [Camellia sinensis var. sinensis]
MQLIMVPNTGLHLCYTKGRASDGTKAEERLEERENVDGAVKELAKLFEELTGNEFEPWEREKKFQKKPRKFYPVDMGDGVDVRHGGLGLRQKGVAVAHCKLDPFVANFMKVLCSQEIYRYALVEMGLDSPDLPMAMLSDVHLKRCDSATICGNHENAERDETKGQSRVVGFQHEMSYGVSVDKIFAAELSACPSYDEIKKMPNKALLWCGTQSSNLLRHLHKGLLPSICSLPVPGYMLGRAIICSDAAAEAATYGFTAVDRPDGFLVLAIASLGAVCCNVFVVSFKQEVKTMEERKVGVKGLGERKQMNQSTLFGRMTSKSLVVDWHPQSTKIVLLSTMSMLPMIRIR